MHYYSIHAPNEYQHNNKVSMSQSIHRAYRIPSELPEGSPAEACSGCHLAVKVFWLLPHLGHCFGIASHLAQSTTPQAFCSPQKLSPTQTHPACPKQGRSSHQQAPSHGLAQRTAAATAARGTARGFLTSLAELRRASQPIRPLLPVPRSYPPASRSNAGWDGIRPPLTSSDNLGTPCCAHSPRPYGPAPPPWRPGSKRAAPGSPAALAADGTPAPPPPALRQRPRHRPLRQRGAPRAHWPPRSRLPPAASRAGSGAQSRGEGGPP